MRVVDTSRACGSQWEMPSAMVFSRLQTTEARRKRTGTVCIQARTEKNGGVLENGILVLPRLGIKMDTGAAIRADRDEQAEQALRRWDPGDSATVTISAFILHGGNVCLLPPTVIQWQVWETLGGSPRRSGSAGHPIAGRTRR
jgi:hypothetical protein